MPRYYDIRLINPKTGNVAVRADKTPYVWTTNPNGQYDPAAHNVHLDLYTTFMAAPAGASSVIIEGVSLADLQEGQKLAGLTLQVSGGMTAGLPLANPKQKGLLLKAQVWQSWGNWVGTDQALTFVCLSSPYTSSTPGNFALIWKKGTALQPALEAMFNTAFPGMPQKITLSDNMIAAQDNTASYTTLESFAAGLKVATTTDTDPGVDIWINAGTVYASDQTNQASSNPTTLVFSDLIGQPSWQDQNVLQFRTVMRADLTIGSSVMMPQVKNAQGQLVTIPSAPGFISTGLASLPSSLKYSTTFVGAFQIVGVHHIGESRSADGGQWCSVFNAIPTATSNETSTTNAG
jgi:hypothetical protein